MDLEAGQLWSAPLRADEPASSWLSEATPLLRLPGPVSCAVRAHDDGWLVLAGGRVLHWHDGRAPRVVADVETDPTRARLNDGAVDAHGRLWVGTMCVPRPLLPWGGLHLVEDGTPARTRTMLDGMLAANGIGWSPDGSLTYAVDSGHRIIHRFRRDVAGHLSPAGPPLRVANGVPDGMTVDDEGCLWVALWDGASVVRMSPEGEVLRRVDLPCSRPTACSLVGSQLVVTTATVPGEEASGWSYVVDAQVTGPAAPRARVPAVPDNA